MWRSQGRARSPEQKKLAFLHHAARSARGATRLTAAPTRQIGAVLGQRLKEAWEWSAVLGQVEVYGWRTLDVRWGEEGWG